MNIFSDKVDYYVYLHRVKDCNYLTIRKHPNPKYTSNYFVEKMISKLLISSSNTTI